MEKYVLKIIKYFRTLTFYTLGQNIKSLRSPAGRQRLTEEINTLFGAPARLVDRCTRPQSVM